MAILTKEYFERRLDGAFKKYEASFQASFEVLKHSIRDLNLSFIASQAKQDERFERRFNGIDERLNTMDTKLDALMEGVFTRNEAHSLVSQLKHNNIPLNEKEIFLH